MPQQGSNLSPLGAKIGKKIPGGQSKFYSLIFLIFVFAPLKFEAKIYSLERGAFLKNLFALGFFLIALLGLAFQSAMADSKIQDCTKLWQLEKEAGCPAPQPELIATGTPIQKDYFTQKKVFGPTKCVTEDDVDKAVEALETKCDQWTDKMKDELKKNNRHIAGVCNHECSPCPKNEVLQKCKVTGEVQYRISGND